VTELGKGYGQETVQEWIDRATCRAISATEGTDVALTDVGGIGPARAAELSDLGIQNAGELVAAEPERLARLLGVGQTPKRVKRYQENAKSVIN
jgi:predicted flap endonuclease-1-like 5' DNA nuclease